MSSFNASRDLLAGTVASAAPSGFSTSFPALRYAPCLLALLAAWPASKAAGSGAGGASPEAKAARARQGKWPTHPARGEAGIEPLFATRLLAGLAGYKATAPAKGHADRPAAPSAAREARREKQNGPCDDCRAGAVPCDSSVSGFLGPGDCLLEDFSYFDIWQFDLPAATLVSIELSSPDFDTYLILLDDRCRAIAENDDCHGLDSCLQGTLSAGKYFIVANSFWPRRTGRYTLAVDCEAPANPCEGDCRAGQVACGETVLGTLDEDDCALDDQSFIELWELTLTEAADVTLFLRSDDFDPFVFLLSHECEVLDANDDCEGLNACLTLQLEAGTYYVGANSLPPRRTGQYLLEVLPCGCQAPPEPVGPSPADEALRVPVRGASLSWDLSELTGRAKVIYGSDDRLDAYEVSDPETLSLLDSTVALIDVSLLEANGDGTLTLRAESLAEFVVGAAGVPLCAGERFRDQPSAAFCSGFLAAPDLLVTAGHCVEDTADVATTAFVFGFRMLEADSARLTIPEDEIYFADGVLGSVVSARGEDWAVVRLDRPVSNHAPLRIRREGKIADGAALLVAGHPLGLPAKVAGGAYVRDNTPAAYFEANLDTYGGSSGSPVINAQTHTVEGVLVRGNEDFAEHTGCLASVRCPDEGCRGEEVTRTREFHGLIPQNGNEEERVHYEVYFSECSQAELPEFQETVDATSWPLPDLDPGTRYCWQILAENGCGEATSPVWTFTTNFSPEAEDGEVTAEVGTVVEGALSASDPDGDPLTFEILREPERGTLRLRDEKAGTFTYEPHGPAGRDRLTFRVSDGELRSPVARFRIEVVEKTASSDPGGNGGGGCSMSPNARPDLSLLVLAAVLAFELLTRLASRGRREE